MTAAAPTSTPQSAPAPRSTRLGPGRTIRLGLRRIRFEVRQYFRAGDQVFFTFLFPTLMYLMFAAIFQGDVGEGTDAVSMATYYLPGLLAGGILLSGVQAPAIEIAMEKSDGTLKRLGAAPLSPVTYFLGKAGQVFTTAVLQSALLIGVALVVFHVDLPTDPAAWARFGGVFLLGLGTCTLLGIALSSLPRSGKSATAVVLPIVLVLQFISGVYLQFSLLPEWLQTVASVFPVKWIAQGMRGALLPESFQAAETTGTWEWPALVLILVGWLAVGAVLSRLTFRWIRADG